MGPSVLTGSTNSSSLQQVSFSSSLTAQKPVDIVATFAPDTVPKGIPSSRDPAGSLLELLLVSSDLSTFGRYAASSAQQGTDGSVTASFSDIVFSKGGQYVLVFDGQLPLPDAAAADGSQQQLQSVSASTFIGVGAQPHNIIGPQYNGSRTGLTEIVVQGRPLLQQQSRSISELLQVDDDASAAAGSSSSSNNTSHTTYRVVLDMPDHCVPGQPATYTWTLRDAVSGEPVTDLQPYGDGAALRLFIASADLSSQPCGAAAGAADRAACEAQGCCWQKAAGRVQGCYKPKQASWATYEVLSSMSPDAAATDLLLGLVQPLLPQYGQDYEQLEVQVRHETPVRLYVKISPAGVRQYEVPETLLPRPGSEQFPAGTAHYKVHTPAPGEPFSLAVSRCSSSSGSSSSGQFVCDGEEGSSSSQQRPRRAAVFNSTGMGLVFKSQYLELSTRLSSATSLYGLGQRTPKDVSNLKLPRNGDKVVLWNYDITSSRMNVNLYGSHPFIMAVEPDGSSLGLLLLSSNGMEVTLESVKLTYRVIGGLFDLYMFLGPTPEAVLQQYQAVVGRPAMPPYWSLGFHQSRWGYRSLGAVQEVVGRYREAGIPLEAIWTDIDYMDRFRDFTFDPVRFPVNAMREFVASLHASGQRWVPIIDCGIPVAADDAAYQEGLAAGVFIKDLTGKPYLGQVWPGAVHYPDFTSLSKTWPWWQQQLARMYSQVQFDGIWIDMNEPSNFCTGEVCALHSDSRLHKLLGGIQAITAGSSKQPHEASHGYLDQELDQLKDLTTCHLDCVQATNGSSSIAYPPYSIAHGVRGSIKQPSALGKKTVAMSATGVDGELLYNTHNIYGLSEAAATHAALETVLGKRPFILTRSSFPGSGRFAAHWSGDNNATWAGLRQSVAALLAAGLWGMPQAGADICGFLGNSTEELCARWMSAGAFYTFSRNHNSLYSSPQEPYTWPAVAAAAKKALGMRYRLLPHLYSWHFRAHVQGGAVAQPLLFAFPDDFVARNVADQWLLGDSVLGRP
ncbi:hypothetical protein OEZ86_014060 [Tetradesmus obliquus]|nr:hypothetical protein OEZ86_014060 [Tetradesmus obliquus]